MTPAARRHDPYAALRVGEIRLMLTASGCAGLANRALAVVIGYQVYALTKSPLMIGFLGLVEAIPAIALSLYGGHVADRTDRRAIILCARLVSFACALAFALISLDSHAASVLALFGVVFVAGLARGFHDPAAIAFEAQVVPQHLTLNASSWFSTVWQGTAIAGPALGGIAYDLVGPVATYAGLATLHANDPCALAPLAPESMQVQLQTVAGPGNHRFHRAQVTITLQAADIRTRAGATGSDAWLVVRVSGDRAIFPVLTNSVVDDQTLPVLVGGDAGDIDLVLRGRGVPAIAFTAPVFLDFDGNGYRAPFQP